ncbi:hypothetical protein [Streptomyces sp. NPDC056844]|uniref:hypothetical protein n=1 Tax=unclassified Streptomyces TaxID=2593676 RepID=UPI003692470D
MSSAHRAGGTERLGSGHWAGRSGSGHRGQDWAVGSGHRADGTERLGSGHRAGLGGGQQSTGRTGLVG